MGRTISCGTKSKKLRDARQATEGRGDMMDYRIKVMRTLDQPATAYRSNGRPYVARRGATDEPACRAGCRLTSVIEDQAHSS